MCVRFVGIYSYTIIPNVQINGANRWKKAFVHLIVYKYCTILSLSLSISRSSLFRYNVMLCACDDDTKITFLEVSIGQRFNVRLMVQHYSDHNAMIPNIPTKRHLYNIPRFALNGPPNILLNIHCKCSNRSYPHPFLNRHRCRCRRIVHKIVLPNGGLTMIGCEKRYTLKLILIP